MILSDEVFDKFIKLIYKRTGLYYENNKKYFVQKRIEKRAELMEMENLNEYFRLVKFGVDSFEFYKLINDLTVNETYFFRDFPQLRNFAEDVLPIVTKDKGNSKKIKIWCAACATGEEPYTLFIILQEMLDKPEEWEIQIIASDINTEVLQSAKRGIYESRAIKDVPPEYLEKYFTKRKEKYLVNLNVRKSVTFKRINLMDEYEMNNIDGCDFIFCRNCLIYFDDESRRNVLASFYESLNPGGFMFLGHSESVGRISSAYKVKRIGDTITYSRPK
ncbi:MULTISPECIES: CheR family methyltransferase [Clostridium]|uniref:Protein-glutamate O-methyltransferase CheR n=1 Tax=Clostridium frigoriphilum TaxID=443253 RepID=A0ABU7UPE4_9CLOT|nr:protein-glutamate O-methyltransferase CheR [Clostridium sp. DSM 17811]MBU3099302.1 protein-glutamate O-methyltransferase CheR [Clostridium sp. DSM 17811]